jgi:hypothetical protein
MASTTIGRLKVLLTADSRKYGSGMKRARGHTKEFGLSIKGVGGMVSRMVPQLAAAAGAALSLTAAFRGFTSQLQRLDDIAKTAQKIGTTTEELSRLQFAGEKTGVQANTLNMALQRMTRRLAEAAKGTGEAKDAVAELGLDAVALAKKGPAAAFYEIADAMEQVPNQADRVRLAMKLFDSEGVALVNTLKGGSKSLEEFARQSDKFGNTVDGKAAKAAEKFNDAMTDLKASVGGVFAQLVQDLAPALTGVVNILANFVSGVRKSVAAVRSFYKENEILIRTLAAIVTLGQSEVVRAGVIAISDSPKAALEDLKQTADKVNQAIGPDMTTAVKGTTFAVSALLASSNPLAKQFGVLAQRATETTIEFTEVSDAMDDMARRAARIFEQTRTPAERLAAQLREIHELSVNGFLDEETARRAITQLNAGQQQRDISVASGLQDNRVSFAAVGAAQATGRKTDAMLRLQKQQAESDKRREDTQSKTLSAIRGLTTEQKIRVVTF